VIGKPTPLDRTIALATPEMQPVAGQASGWRVNRTLGVYAVTNPVLPQYKTSTFGRYPRRLGMVNAANSYTIGQDVHGFVVYFR
jgi:hypothetical protein